MSHDDGKRKETLQDDDGVSVLKEHSAGGQEQTENTNLKLLNSIKEDQERFLREWQEFRVELRHEWRVFRTEFAEKQRLDSDEFREKLKADIERNISDHMAQYTESINFIKQAILQMAPWSTRERQFTNETVLPKSISSYMVQEIPARPWNPPKPQKR